MKYVRCPDCIEPFDGPKPLWRVVRESINDLDDRFMAAVPDVIDALASAGAIRDIHVGLAPGDFTTDMMVEWFAGQILETLQGEHFFAVDSMINCVDKFCPCPTADTRPDGDL